MPVTKTPREVSPVHRVLPPAHLTHRFFLYKAPARRSFFDIHLYHTTYCCYLVSANRVGPCDTVRPDTSIHKIQKSMWSLQGRTSVYDTLGRNERRLSTRMNGKKVWNAHPLRRNNRRFIYSPEALKGPRITLPRHFHEQNWWQNERIIKCGPRSNHRETPSMEFH